MSKLTALITGASGGIGLEFAKLHAKYHYDLVLVARNEIKLQQIKHELEASHPIQVWVVSADLTTSNGVQRVIDFTKSSTLRIDHLINNAGIGVFGKLHQTSMDAHKKLIDLNISALVTLTHHFTVLMAQHGSGKVLNVASTAAFMPGPYMSTYFASKAFVLSFGEAVNSELRGSGVSVTTLCPGPTNTGFEAVTDGMTKSGLFSKQKVSSAREVAKDGYFAMMKPKPIIISGFLNKMAAFSIRLSPRSFVTAITKSIVKPMN
jgi:short-subunit dehydrogenase